MAVPATTAPTDRRSRLVAAAERVFAREGLGAPVPAIAREAGVGVGTVYREFASKEELIAALAIERLRWHREQLEAALAADDRREALRALLWRAAERQAHDHVAGAALAATGDDAAVRAERRRCVRLRRTLLAEVAPDVSDADIQLVFAALRGVVAEGRDWRRAFALLMAGLGL